MKMTKSTIKKGDNMLGKRVYCVSIAYQDANNKTNLLTLFVPEKNMVLSKVCDEIAKSLNNSTFAIIGVAFIKQEKDTELTSIKEQIESHLKLGKVNSLVPVLDNCQKDFLSELKTEKDKHIEEEEDLTTEDLKNIFK